MDSSLRVRTAVGSLWGRTPSELTTVRGNTLDEMVPKHIAAGIQHHFEAALKGQTRRFEIVTHTTYRCTIAPVLDDSGEIAGALAMAFSEDQALQDERAAAAELARRLSQQSAVARLGELALRRPQLDVLVDAACVAVAEGLGTDAAQMFEIAGPDGLVHVRAAHGWGEDFVGTEFHMESLADERRERYASGPVVIDDLPNDPAWRARPLRERGFVSSAMVLVGPADAPTGLLGAQSRSRRSFGGRDLDFLSAVAHVLNGAMRSLEVERQIRHDALHDALTGLPNRTLLLERLTDAVRRADGEGRQLALYFLDVDHLKVLNDSLGHHAGDELLREIGPRLRSVLRPGDMIARFGGDEFAVLCDEIADEAQGLRVAERLVRAFAQPFEVCGEPRFCSISVGVVVTDPHGTRGAEELLSDADAALYRAKERGRGRHEVFDAGMRDRITTRLRIEDDLRRALDSGDQLWIAYQPIVRLPRPLRGERRGAAALDAPATRPDPARRLHRGRRGLRADRRAGGVGAAHRLHAGRRMGRRAAAHRQRLGAPDGAHRHAGHRRRRAARHRPGGGPARPGDHRGPAARGDAGDDRDPAGAAAAGRAADARRLRHGLLVAGLPAPLSDRRAQDRPLVRARPRRGRPRRRRDRPGDHRHGEGAGPARDPRGRGDRGAADAADRARLQLRAGLPPRAPGGRSGAARRERRRAARVPALRGPRRRSPTRSTSPRASRPATPCARWRSGCAWPSSSGSPTTSARRCSTRCCSRTPAARATPRACRRCSPPTTTPPSRR